MGYWQRVSPEVTFLNVKIKKKDLKFPSTNISVFFLRPFPKYTKIIYIHYLQR